MVKLDVSSPKDRAPSSLTAAVATPPLSRCERTPGTSITLFPFRLICTVRTYSVHHSVEPLAISFWPTSLSLLNPSPYTLQCAVIVVVSEDKWIAFPSLFRCSVISKLSKSGKVISARSRKAATCLDGIMSEAGRMACAKLRITVATRASGRIVE